MEDEIALIRHAIATEKASGVLNGVAPEPVTNRELTAALGEVLSRPTVLAAPAFALRLGLGGDMADELLLASQRVMPVHTLEYGFKFKYPLLRGALRDLLKSR
jgi:NAD dependent epimerase/dehydratase family enzyme